MPRSLARNAVHPPYRLHNNLAPKSRSKRIYYFCVVIISLFIISVLGGISYFSFDISHAKKQISTTISDYYVQNPNQIPNPNLIPNQNTDNNNNNNNQIQTNTQQLPQLNSIPNPLLTKISPKLSIESAIPKSLESILRPNRNNPISEVNTDRLINIEPPSNHQEQQEHEQEEEEEEEIKIVNNNINNESMEIDEPLDEETATNIDLNIILKDINPLNPLCDIKNKPNTINQSKYSFNDKYTDWWNFPILHQTLLTSNENNDQIYCNTRHKAEYELSQTRKDWFKQLEKDNKLPITNSNQFDQNGCIIYDKNNEFVKWHPPNKYLCNWYNDAIFWHTMHGTKIGWDFRKAKPGEHWVWDLATELNDKRQNNTCECPPNVAFIFADNQKKEDGMRLIERSYQLCNKNCNYFHVSKNYEPWDWYGKIGPILDLCKNITFQNKFDYIVLTDADDQTLVRSPIDIIERFETYEADLVCGGEDTSYPQWLHLEKQHENRVSPWSKHHQHLNAGGYMGNVKKMIPYLEWLKNDYLNFTLLHQEEIQSGERNKWRDQTALRQLYRKYYPNVKLDSLALLWSRVDIYMYDL